MSDFVRRKEEWLRAVAADTRLHEWAPLAVAVALGSYLNSISEEAWPGIERLAEDLNADRRSCQLSCLNPRRLAALILCCLNSLLCQFSGLSIPRCLNSLVRAGAVIKHD
jgi:hypothetical protein